MKWEWVTTEVLWNVSFKSFELKQKNVFVCGHKNVSFKSEFLTWDSLETFSAMK